MGLVYLAVFLYQNLAVHDGLDPWGLPQGHDFVMFYAAAVLVNAGKAAQAYVPAILFEGYRTVLGAPTLDFPNPCYYPPFTLLLAAPLAWLPYLWAIIVWSLGSLAGYLLLLSRAIAPHPLSLWLALAFPGVLMNLVYGQTGFWTALLLGGGLQLMTRHPFLGGAILGLATFKPHLVALIPIALIAGRSWMAVAGFVATVLALLLTSLGMLGLDTWQAFLEVLPMPLRALQGNPPRWAQMVTPFAGMRLMGFGPEVAGMVQGAVALGVVLFIIWMWGNGRTPPAVRAAALALAALLATPHGFEYDLPLLALALAWTGMEAHQKGWRSGEAVLWWLLWCVPFLGRGLASGAGIPATQIFLLVFLGNLRHRVEPRNAH